MRKYVVAAVGAATILMAGSMATPSQAMPIGSTLRPAIDAVNPVEKAGCWRQGWHGWGWYPWCGGYGPRPYWGPGYWGPRPFWGWRHRWWR